MIAINAMCIDLPSTFPAKTPLWISEGPESVRMAVSALPPASEEWVKKLSNRGADDLKSLLNSEVLACALPSALFADVLSPSCTLAVFADLFGGKRVGRSRPLGGQSAVWRCHSTG
eukprot:scaffold1845_cov257-Pinguiococcus_pyrenoidosus.AAC.2